MFLAQTAHRAAALLLSWSLFCAPLPARQAQAPSGLQSLKTIAPDSKRAQKALERGEKAEAEGRVDDAVIAYDEALRYAPQDMAIAGRIAALRSRLVRSHVENAERLGVAGNIPQAIEELQAAMRIDPTNGVVAERIGADGSNEGRRTGASSETHVEGMPHLKAQERQAPLRSAG